MTALTKNRTLKVTQLIMELKDKRAQQEKCLEELEYVLYMKYLWESRDPEPFEEKSSYYMKFAFASGKTTKGWFVLVRTSDKAEIRFPIHIQYRSFLGGVTDMWDNGEIPERVFEIFFECNGSKDNSDIGVVGNYRRLRDKRLKKNDEFRETYGKDRTPMSLMEPYRVTASGSEVRLDSFVADEVVQEVGDSTGEEGTKSQEGKEVA